MKQCLSWIVICVLLSFLTIVADAQHSAVHIVTLSGDFIPTQYPYYPRQNFKDDSIIYSIVFRVERDSLFLVDTLNATANRYTYPVAYRHFQSKRWITLQSKELDEERLDPDSSSFAKSLDLYVSIIDYSGDSLFVTKLGTDSLSLPDYCLNKEKAYLHHNKLYVDLCNMPYDKDYRSMVYDRDLRIRPFLPSSVFIDSSYSSYVGGGFEHSLVGWPYFPEDSRLKASTSQRQPLRQWPDYQYQTPFDTTNGNYHKSFRLLYNTPLSKWLVGQRRPASTYYNRAEVLILNKELQSWRLDSLPLYGTPPSVYCDSLLYGTVYRSCYLPTCNERDSILSYRIQNPQRYSERYGFTPSVAKMSGRFFFYNLSTSKYLEVKLPELDAEALLIEDDVFYFRVFDSIYSMSISDVPDFEMSNASLLARDSVIVPHVHSLFVHRSK